MNVFVEEKIQTGTGKIHCLRSAPAEATILFLHGLSRRWRSFLTLFSGLPRGVQIQALDFRGHGKSGRFPGAYRVIDYVEDAAAVLKRSESPVILYGHSLGAMVAAAVAADFPQVVTGVILEDPPFEAVGEHRIREGSLHSFFEGLQRLAGSGDSTRILSRRLANMRFIDHSTNQTLRLGDLRTPESIRFTAKSLKRIDPATFDPVLTGDWLRGYDRLSVFDRLSCPVLLLQADPQAGGMLTDEDAIEAASRIANCRHVKFPETPHLIHWAKPGEVMRLIKEFVASI